MKKKINGWQRLWIVFTGAYLLIALTVTIYLMPTEDRIPSILIDNSDISLSIFLESKYPTRIDADKHNSFYKSDADKHNSFYKSMTMNQIMDHLQTNIDNKISLSPSEARYYEDVLKFTKERRVYFYIATLWHIIPPALIYLIGSSIAWIIRGFRDQTNKSY